MLEPTPSPDVEDLTPVASVWHTSIVVLFLFGGILLSVMLGYRPGSLLAKAGVSPGHAREIRYVVGIAAEWLIVAFIAWGVRARGGSLRMLVGERWPPRRALFRDVGLGVGAFVVIALAGGMVSALLKVTHYSPGLLLLLPRTPIELLIFFGVALTAGICEEIIFRGYLMRQLTAATKHPATGVALQAIIFGVGHGYQGAKHILAIAVIGVLLGVLARWRRSLYPGMIAHVIQDGFAGIVAYHVLR